MLRGLAVVAVLALFVPSAFAAHAATRTYVIANGLFQSGSVGGATFPAGEVPRSVVADDDLGTSPALLVCQDLDDDGGCHEDLEPGTVACGRVDLSMTKVPYVASVPTTVFVAAHAAACPGQVGTSGILTVAYR